MSKTAYRRALSVAGWAAAGMAAVGLPLVVWLSDTPLAGNTWGKEGQLFELFGFSAAALLLGVAVARMRRLGSPVTAAHVAAALPVAVGLFWAGLVGDFWQPRDWVAYRRAAEAAAEGRSLYSDQTALYLYPPLTAEALQLTRRVVGSGLELAGVGEDGDRAWTIVFYLYQCVQLAAVLAAYRLLVNLAHRCGWTDVRGDVLAAGLLVLNNPLYRTYQWGQVNLLVLDCGLAGVLLANRWAAAAGFALAVAIHIKLYPLLLLVPLLVMRRRRAIAWTVAAFAVIGAVEIALAGPAGWRDFLAFLPRFPDFTALRANSVLSLSANTARLLVDADPAAAAAFSRIVFASASVLFLGWFLWRTVGRERSYGRQSGGADALVGRRLGGHTADAFAFALLMSPVAWEHHFVLALPLVVHAVTTAAARHPALVALGTALVVAAPTFDLYPLSYCRLVGLLLLLVATTPRVSANAAVTTGAPVPN